MSKPRSRQRRNRRVIARGIRRQTVDLGKLSRALLAIAQAEAEAQAEHERRHAAGEEASDD